MHDVPDGSKELPAAPRVLPRDAVQRWRLVLAREAIPPDAAQREQQATWDRALAGSGLPIAGLDAERPRPRWALAAPLAAAIPGESELLDVWLVERLPVWHVRAALLRVLPGAWRLVDLHDVWLGEPALPGRVAGSVYRATFAPAPGLVDRLAAAAHDLLASRELPRARRKGEATVAYDLRPFLDSLEVGEAADGRSLVLRLQLRHDPEKGVGRPEEALAALAEQAGTPLAPTSLVRERLVLAEPTPPPAPAPRRRPAAAPRAGGGGRR